MAVMSYPAVGTQVQIGGSAGKLRTGPRATDQVSIEVWGDPGYVEVARVEAGAAPRFRLNRLNVVNQDGTIPEAVIENGEIEVPANGSVFQVDTEGMGPTDNLDTINSGQVGDLVFMRGTDASRTVWVRHGEGNILLRGAFSRYILRGPESWITLVYDGSNWIELGRADVGSGFPEDFPAGLDLNDSPNGISQVGDFRMTGGGSGADPQFWFGNGAIDAPGEIDIYGFRTLSARPAMSAMKLFEVVFGDTGNDSASGKIWFRSEDQVFEFTSTNRFTS